MVKVALIGAGSGTFALNVITDILAIDGLDDGTFALVDLDTQRLELSQAVAEQVIQAAGKRWTVRATTNRRSVLPGCDYVFNMIEVGGPENARLSGTRAAERARLLSGTQPGCRFLRRRGPRAAPTPGDSRQRAQ